MRTSKRFLLIAVSFGIVLIVGLVMALKSPDVAVHSNASSNEHIERLRAKAKVGDNDARMELSLLVQGTPEAEELLRSAADSGHPPAIVALARTWMSGDVQAATLARAKLEALARSGYYPAILELASCIEEGQCGPASATDAYMWTLVSRDLSQRGLIGENLLASNEMRLKGSLSPSERQATMARAVATSRGIPKVLM